MKDSNNSNKKQQLRPIAETNLKEIVYVRQEQVHYGSKFFLCFGGITEKLRELTKTQILVFMRLAESIEKANHAFMTVKQLAEKLHLGENKVSEALSVLHRHGLVLKCYHKGGTLRGAHELDPSVVWMGSAKEYNGEIPEQDKEYYEPWIITQNGKCLAEIPLFRPEKYMKHRKKPV